MNREEARQYFVDSGLTVGDVNKSNLEKLYELLVVSLKKSGLMEGEYKVHGLPVLQMTPDGPLALIRCKSFYFEDREAITINPDGFIGFAGWADEKNLKPIIDAFVLWVDEMKLANRPKATV